MRQFAKKNFKIATINKKGPCVVQICPACSRCDLMWMRLISSTVNNSPLLKDWDQTGCTRGCQSVSWRTVCNISTVYLFTMAQSIHTLSPTQPCWMLSSINAGHKMLTYSTYSNFQVFISLTNWPMLQWQENICEHTLVTHIIIS